MLDSLKLILEIQELDMKMIQLIQLKQQRQKELKEICSGETALSGRIGEQETQILELKKSIRLAEGELNETLAKIKKLESQQNQIKKVDEYNAITHEIAAADREKLGKEQKLSDALDRLANGEDLLKNLKESLQSTFDNSQLAKQEIEDNIQAINQEGRSLKAERDALVGLADPFVFSVYERLLHNKQDRVVVSLENRCCSGCHILLTAQHENLVRKGERLVFCEHCSRIHYWQESKALEDSVVATKQRRRRSTAAPK